MNVQQIGDCPRAFIHYSTAKIIALSKYRAMHFMVSFVLTTMFGHFITEVGRDGFIRWIKFTSRRVGLCGADWMPGTADC